MSPSDTRCGFTLKPENLTPYVAAIYENNAESKWYLDFSVATCWRPCAEGEDNCIWHAGNAGPSTADLAASRIGRPECLDGASLTGVSVDEEDGLDFRDCSMRGAEFVQCEFNGIDFSGSTLLASMVLLCDFPRCDLSNINLRSSYVLASGFNYVDMEGANYLTTTVEQSYFGNVDFDNCLLVEARFEGCRLKQVSFIDTYIAEAKFVKSELPYAKFSEANAHLSIFAGCDLRYAWFKSCNISDASFPGCDMYGADLRDATLRNATFHINQKYGANLREALLIDADARGADFTNANLYAVNYRGLLINDETDFDLKCSYERAADNQLALGESTNRDSGGNQNSDSDDDLLGLSEINPPQSAVIEKYRKKESYSDPNTPTPPEIIRAPKSKGKLVGIRWLKRDLANSIPYIWFRNWWRRGEQDPRLLEQAAATYRDLKKLYEEQGNDYKVRNYHIREKHAKRKLARANGDHDTWLRYAFSRSLMQYGESVKYVLIISILVIGISSVLYPMAGLRTGSGELISYQSQTIVEAVLGGLYFSAVTFTASGYGDISPIGLSRVVATIESFSGVVLVAVFVFVLGRLSTR